MKKKLQKGHTIELSYKHALKISYFILCIQLFTETPTLPWAGDLPLWGEFSKISRSPAWVWFSPAQVGLDKK